MATSNQIILQGISRDDLLSDFRAIVRSEFASIPRQKQESKYMDIDEVCILTVRSKKTIYDLTHQRKIPFIKRGKKLLFVRPDIEKWLDDAKQPVEN